MKRLLTIILTTTKRIEQIKRFAFDSGYQAALREHGINAD